MSATFLDYVGYFFVGYKTEQMDQNILAFLRGIHYVLGAFVAAVASSVIYSVSHGKDIWDLATWQAGAAAGILYVLGVGYELLRKKLNPSVSLKTLPESTPEVPAAPPITQIPPAS